MKAKSALPLRNPLAHAIAMALALSCGTQILANAVWKTAADGSWTDTENWEGGILPSAASLAIITNDTSAYTVTLDAPEPQTAKGLVISGLVANATHPTRLNVNSPLILDGADSMVARGGITVGNGGVLDIRNSGLRLGVCGELVIDGGELYGTNGFTQINLNAPEKISSSANKPAFRMTSGTAKFKLASASEYAFNLNGFQLYKNFEMTGGKIEIEGVSGNNSSFGIYGYGYGATDNYFTLSGDAEMSLKNAGFQLGWGTVNIGGNASLTVTGNDSHSFNMCHLSSDSGREYTFNLKDNSKVQTKYLKYVLFGKADARTLRTVGTLNISGGDHSFSRYCAFGEGTGTYAINVSGGRTTFSGYGVRMGTYPLNPANLTAARAYTNATSVKVTGGALVFNPTESLNNSAKKSMWGTVLGYGMTTRTDFEFKASMDVSGGVVTNSIGPFYVGAGNAEGHLLQTGGEIYKAYPEGTADYNYCMHSLVLGFAGGNGAWTIASGCTTCLPTVFVGGVRDHATSLKIGLESQTFPDNCTGKAQGTLTVTNTGSFAAGWNVYVGHDGSGVIEMGDQASFSCGYDLFLTNSPALPGAAATLKFRLSGSQPPSFTVTRRMYIAAGSKLEVDASDFTFPTGVQDVKLIGARYLYGAFANEDVTLIGRNIKLVQKHTDNEYSFWLRKILGLSIVVK